MDLVDRLRDRLKHEFGGLRLADFAPLAAALAVPLTFALVFGLVTIVAETQGINVRAMFTQRGTAPQSEPPLVGVDLDKTNLSPQEKAENLALDRRETARIMAEYPEHYRCRSYPGQPTRAEARPTANVLVIIQYIGGEYKVTHGDGRVHVTQKDVIFPADYAHPTSYPHTTFSWTYRNEVSHFGVFIQNWMDGVPDRWSVPKSTPGNHGLSLDATAGVNRPTVIIVASDQESCYPSNHEQVLPATIWQELAAAGLAEPQL